MSRITVIHGLRLRCTGPGRGLICQRCTAVLRDAGEAERHVCVTRFYLAGMEWSRLETPDVPDRMRERIRIVNHASFADLWPHSTKKLPRRGIAPLHQRYETLSVLFAELAAFERIGGGP